MKKDDYCELENGLATNYIDQLTIFKGIYEPDYYSFLSRNYISYICKTALCNCALYITINQHIHQ